MKNISGYFTRYTTVSLALVLVMLTGCASSTSVLTGNRRPTVPIDQVKVYADLPANCETIGLVQSHSVIGLGDQGHMDAALSELRAEAGRLGANGVVLIKTESRPLAYIGNSGKSGSVGFPIETPHLEGRAIFVTAH